MISPPSAGVETWNDNANFYTTEVLFNGTGVYTQTLTAFGYVCTFAPPVASPPWPPAVGQSFSGQSTCQGRATVTVSGHVDSTESVTLGDTTSVATFIVRTTISIGGTTLSANLTDWYAPSLRLPIKTQVTLGATSDTYLLTSNTPA